MLMIVAIEAQQLPIAAIFGGCWYGHDLCGEQSIHVGLNRQTLWHTFRIPKGKV